MAELPSGTVSLLFSDIEGSTALLSRLGPAYAEALEGQRKVLRTAWADHGGIELGTEGDSFMVVFPTAEDAVGAAVQAQRELAAFDWPGGEKVRVRMGVHTGTPTVHDGGYVGMDVHRAARIAGAAHGGQVVLSSSTAELVGGCLPDGVALRNLGRHQLKDIAQPEHLYQLAIDGLPSQFPPIKTLGAASSLPRPATPLVGRDGELAELIALMSSPHVRLVTLTGPGGTGKTRLAIGVAERLRDGFPDGVYFVPLAAATTADVMWTSIGEVLDVPPEGRIPPGFFEHVAHRSALFVLDNLEQVAGADEVVEQLLDAAPQVVVVATSRRPLHVLAEHEHPVPPLELPEQATVSEAETSGAVQMFVQHARKVRPSFRITADNAADVVEVCRRLDGLPLAIELTATRSKLMSPKALLTRLGQALDLTATDKRVSRQNTLRDTIAWSHDLLTPQQQMFFRRLAVFSGGADLDAIAAVITSDSDSADPFDLVAELVDASLVTITETPDGEPRVGMLETIRTFALDQLTVSGELDEVRDRHTRHYVELAEQWRSQLLGGEQRAARSQYETDHDNFREALTWTLRPDKPSAAPVSEPDPAMRLCVALSLFWDIGGYWAEQRRWLERAIAHGGGSESAELARCLTIRGWVAARLGDLDAAYESATASVDMWRRLDDNSRQPEALRTLAIIEADRGQPGVARATFEEALRVARAINDSEQVEDCLANFGLMEACEGNFERSLSMNNEAIAIARERGDSTAARLYEHNMACTMRMTGQVEDAQRHMRNSIPHILRDNEPAMLMVLAEDYAAVLCDLGQHPRAVRLLGAAEAMRERLGVPRPGTQQADLAEPIAKTRAALTLEEWDDAYQAGRNTTIEDALTEAHAANIS
jgi:predicted ATPase/class 3 adenylate cyclase